MNCVSCKKEVKEVCADGYCRACHVSCSWEDCVTQNFEAKGILNNTPPSQRVEVKAFLKKIYPHAKILREKAYAEIG